VTINLNQARATFSSSAEGAAPEHEQLPNMVNTSNLKPIQNSQYDKLSSERSAEGAAPEHEQLSNMVNRFNLKPKRRSSIVKLTQEAQLQPAALESTLEQSLSELHRPELESILTHERSRANSHFDGKVAPQEPKWEPTACKEALIDDDMEMSPCFECAEDNMADNHLHDMVTKEPRAPLREPLPTPPKSKPKRLKTREEKQARNEVKRMAREEAAQNRLSGDVLARQKSKHIVAHSLVRGHSIYEEAAKKATEAKEEYKASITEAEETARKVAKAKVAKAKAAKEAEETAVELDAVHAATAALKEGEQERLVAEAARLANVEAARLIAKNEEARLVKKKQAEVLAVKKAEEEAARVTAAAARAAISDARAAIFRK